MVTQVPSGAPAFAAEAGRRYQQLEQAAGKDRRRQQVDPSPSLAGQPEDSRDHGPDHGQVQPDLVEGRQGEAVQHVEHAAERAPRQMKTM